MRNTPAVTLLLLTAIFGFGCGEDRQPGERGTVEPAHTTIAPKPASLVGRWELVRTCQAMVNALQGEHLGVLAPGVVGDYFPGVSPLRLARKRDLCSGARPQRHSHFFTEDGEFGSLDADDRQVDDGHYRITGDTFRLGRERIRFRIARHDRLIMRPLISAEMRRAALAHPLHFSPAGHAVAVALPGQVWRRTE